MPDMLQGNYDLPNQNPKRPAKGKRKPDEPQSLTAEFEQSALAKLGGSMCFVMKGKTFLWTGEGTGGTDEEPGK